MYLYFINSVFLVQGKLSTTSLLAGEKTVGSDEQWVTWLSCTHHMTAII